MVSAMNDSYGQGLYRRAPSSNGLCSNAFPSSNFRRKAQLALTFVCLVSSPLAVGATPLLDPVPESIPYSGITLIAEPFVRAPKSEDEDSRSANTAWARIQYLKPFPDRSGRLLFNDTRGILYLTDQKGRQPEVFLDLRKYRGFGFDETRFPNEAGLAGFAFHPQFAEPGKSGYGRFYIAYSARPDSGQAQYLENDAASHHSVIREWTMSDPTADRFSGSSREVFRIGQFASNHNIGNLDFNPTAKPGNADYGLLYAGLGDGGAANDPRDYGQSKQVPLGSLIRIDPLGGDHRHSYAIPPSNPFADQPDLAGEIWAYGLRHPQHFSWDTDGRLFINDIGQNQIEEINVGQKGANYGWRLREGTFATAYAVTGAEAGPVYPLPPDRSDFVLPLAQYDHDEGSAISSGFVYRGDRLPALAGKYLFTDLVRGRLFAIDVQLPIRPGTQAHITEIRIDVDGSGETLLERASMPNTLDPGLRVDLRLSQDAAGELYLLTKADGWIRRLASIRMADPEAG